MADLTINAAAVSTSSLATIRREYSGGATLTAGQLVYKNASNQWVTFDSDAGSGAGANVADMRGIALNNCANGQPLAVCTADPNFAIGATVANGVSYYGSVNTGAITATVPVTANYTVHLGVAISTTRINLNPTASGVAV